MNNIVNQFPSPRINDNLLVGPNTKVVQPKTAIFRMGESLPGIYLVNSGAVKLFCTTESGEEHIAGFSMPGELIGLDALEDGVSRTSAVTLDTSNLSLIPFNTLLGGSKQFDYCSFIQQIGTTLNRESNHTMILSQRTAERRVAWFLIEFSEGLASRGLNPNWFTLPMTRADLALFLGLAVETVCRELATLCESGAIKKNRRRIEIRNLEQLKMISKGAECELHQQCHSQRVA